MKARFTLLSLALLAVPLAAQSQPCASANDQNNNLPVGLITAFGFAGAGHHAYQYTPSTSLVARAMQILTDRPISTSTGFMSLEVWTDDGSGTLPGTRITGGSWTTDFALPAPIWQGANFDQVAVLQQGTPYWLVWIEPHSSVPAFEPGGATLLPKAYRAGTGAWTTRSPEAFKFRLFCTLLDGQNATPSGSPCAAAAGTVGTLFNNQQPGVGNALFRLEGSGFPPGVLTFLVMGLTQNFPSIPLPGLPMGCFQHSDAVTVAVGTTGTGDVRASSVLGHVAFSVPVPANAGLAGLFVSSQLGVLDPGATSPIPFVTSNAMNLTLF